MPAYRQAYELLCTAGTHINSWWHVYPRELVCGKTALPPGRGWGPRSAIYGPPSREGMYLAGGGDGGHYSCSELVCTTRDGRRHATCNDSVRSGASMPHACLRPGASLLRHCHLREHVQPYFVLPTALSEPPVVFPCEYEWAPTPAKAPLVIIWYSLRISTPSRWFSKISRTPAA